jgi:serine phosphatase RsbU (regulator of sigma subunit)/DNA-binding NarL/FixJ family response regulator
VQHDYQAAQAAEFHEKGNPMSNSDPIRVMIVDDHSMVRRGLATILRVRPGMELVGEASNGYEALQKCEQVRPDVILMDLVMPEMDGAAATRTIRAQYPQIQVIALTSFKEKELVQGALEAGAIGYLLKNVSAEELADAIRAAYAGRPTLAPEVAQVLLQADRLEQLARALVDAPPDTFSLSDILAEHIPAIFADSQIEIRLFPGQVLLCHPGGSLPVPSSCWEWLHTTSDSHCILPGMSLPWGGSQPAEQGLIIAPILSAEGREPIGGIYVARDRDPGAMADLLPMVKSLAAQITSALHSAQLYAQTQAHQKIARELAMAGQIQASFLPSSLPSLAGWQIAVTLEPARETSGDFYDFIPLPDGHLGLVIADVSDKGMGAALYMALSRTLIRTYAAEFPTRPDLVLSATSRRILEDTRAGLFVTAFYGILEPASGSLRYCNAGHNPPYLFNRRADEAVQVLGKTGMALGAVEDTTWTHSTVCLEPGNTLVLYTDGITEAQDEQGDFFGRQRLLSVLQAETSIPRPHKHAVLHVQEALLGEVRQFMGTAPQHDDMTLMILLREF